MLNIEKKMPNFQKLEVLKTEKKQKNIHISN